MSIQKQIEQKLYASLDIQSLVVINESHMHRGHAGDDGSGESHFLIEIKSEDLNNLRSVEAHKKIYQILNEEMKIIHALAIRLYK